MSFDKDTRNLLAKTVAACRRRLLEDVTDQLRGVFGLHPDGTVLPLEKLTHLSPDQHAAARRLRDLLDHYTAGAAGQDSDRRKAAYERMVLEISFTALNRLAALRLCEERGLVVECVRKGTTSAGFQMFERISGGALGGRYDTYRVFLECMFDELALDLGVLFDRMTPQSAVFPSERCMEDVLAELNKPELTHLWTEDETIGWVYQYFNPPEERKAMREASQAPRNSRELAVRNQFFTPRYVVEFLTDNTLGRIWYEMRKGDTILKEECRYLVRRPNEVFLGPGEKAPAEKGGEADLSQEELLKRPVYIEHRPKKDPRDLRILDPACGSGHFLLYAFDLLERIYEEAWGDPESPKSEATGRTIQEDFEAIDDLRREVPKLVVEHNLHGIDIDPRAVQIAALALWLRAQKTWKNLGLKAPDRPRIARSNIVTAEPMPGEEDMRREFTAGLKPRVLGQIMDEVFEKMKLAGEAGSLLKIEEEIKDAVAAAKRQWAQSPRGEQMLLPGLIDLQPKQQELRFDVKGVTDERFWDQAEDRILDALKEYAERAENGHATRRRLFAEDAARGFAFIDLCRKRYDVVLMNPPFGKATGRAEGYLRKEYKEAWTDIYGAFLWRFVHNPQTYTSVGAISSSLFLYTKQMRELRGLWVSYRSLHYLVELGSGILDGATVDTALTVSIDRKAERTLFLDLTKDDKRTDKLAEAARSQCLIEQFAERSLADFSNLYLQPFCYHMESSKLRLWKAKERIDPTYATVAVGNNTFDDFRFQRARWEVYAHDLGEPWAGYEEGGEFQPFFSPTPLVYNWGRDGSEARAFQIQKFGTDAQVKQSVGWWKTPGLTYPRVSSIGFGPRVLPPNHIFSGDSISIFPKMSENTLPLLGFLVSTWAQDLTYAFGRYRKIEARTIKNLPLPSRNFQACSLQLQELANIGFLELTRLESVKESSALFVLPFNGKCAFPGQHSELSSRNRIEKSLQIVLNRIDDLVAHALFGDSNRPVCQATRRSELVRRYTHRDYTPKSPTEDLLSYSVGSAFGRWDVRIALDPSLAPKLPDPFDPLPICPPGMLVGPDGLPAEPGGIVSEEWLRARPDANTLPPDGSVKNPTIPDSEYPLRISWDGVLVDDPGSNGDQPHRDDIVRRVREVFDLLWKDKSHEIEQEACDILGVSDLRDYFRKPAGFFQDHLKRYSKSRRKAPIYWPLSTASGSYTIWLYYHRLNDQTLYMVVNKYVEPKISEVERGIAQIENELKAASGREATRLTDRLNEARAFLGELRDLREELLRIAALPYKPDLNDGVIINAAPLHKLFRLRSWAKDTEDCWRKLEKGDYDWAHLAYTIWPDRVRKVCRTDRSIAVAHGLEDLCEVEAPESKKKGGRGRRKKKEP